MLMCVSQDDGDADKCQVKNEIKGLKAETD